MRIRFWVVRDSCYVIVIFGEVTRTIMSPAACKVAKKSSDVARSVVGNVCQR